MRSINQEIEMLLENQLKLTAETKDTLRCPVCRGNLSFNDAALICTNLADCKSSFPVKDGIPILINEANSIFSIDDYLNSRRTYFDPNKQPSPFKQKLGMIFYEGGID